MPKAFAKKSKTQSAFDLESYLESGVGFMVREIVAATADDPREAAFALRFSASATRASSRRARTCDKGRHVPPFLICSITSRCNLHCVGCYAWANHICNSNADQLPAEFWDSVFSQASDLGISFVLLAGGEPCLRIDVLERAAAHRDMLFPVFTNGTLMDAEHLDLFDDNRNLVPILSIEGDAAITDDRRGVGIHARLMQAMADLTTRHVLFGVSITVTSVNIDTVLSDVFIYDLMAHGARAVIFVEYVPFDGSAAIALDTCGRERLAQGVDHVRSAHADRVIVSFPGDEGESGGCLAAGRGFCHINVHGGVEPCPFSPFSDTSLTEVSLAEALDSPLFRKLRARGLLEHEHVGGCTLFQVADEVHACIEEGATEERKMS